MIKIASFDVFDTCLTRLCGSPSTVFHLVADRLLTILGQPSDESWVEDFVAARIGAERWSRQQSKTEETTLEDIWIRLCEITGLDPSRRFEQIELEVERENLRGIGATRHRIEAERVAGRRIIFVSDTYLPSAFISEQLQFHRFSKSGDGLYVSSHTGLTKASGAMFVHVLEREKATGAEVVHCGDNIQGDVVAPRRFGISSGEIKDALPSSVEASVLDLCASGNVPLKRLAGVMRSLRIGSATPEAELVSQFLGPFLTTLASWVLQQAQAAGIRRLYFAARDCQLLCKVATVLAPNFDQIECQYLHISRQALFLPSAAGVGREHMPWMFRSFERPTLKRLLAKLELEFSDVAEWYHGEHEDSVVETEAQQDQFWQVIQQDQVKAKVLRTMMLRRRTAVRYFESMSMLDSDPWAFVDLGWYLTGLQALGNILKSEGREGPMKGIYLGLNLQRLPRSVSGETTALFYEGCCEIFEGKAGLRLFDAATILEHVVGIADHPSVHHYGVMENGSVGPFGFEAAGESTLHNRLASELRDFASECVPFAYKLAGSQMASALVLTLLSQFISIPTKKMLVPLSNLLAGSDQNNFDSTLILRRLTWREALAPAFPRRPIFRAIWGGVGPLWIEASAVMSPPIVHASYRLCKWLEKLRLQVASNLRAAKCIKVPSR